MAKPVSGALGYNPVADRPTVQLRSGTKKLLTEDDSTGGGSEAAAVFTYAATRQLDLATASDFRQTDAMTGDMAIQLINPLTDRKGVIWIRQDATGNRSITSVTAVDYRTMTDDGVGFPIAKTPLTITILHYWLSDVGGIKALYVSIDKPVPLPLTYPHPLTFLSNVVYYMDPATAYVHLHSNPADRYILTIDNRGSIGGAFTAAGGYNVRQRLADTRFNSKPTVVSPVDQYNGYLTGPSLTGVSMPEAECFCVGAHDPPFGSAPANTYFTGFHNIGNAAGDITYVPNVGDGKIYDGFGSNVRHSFPSMGTALDSPWLINIRSKPTEWVWRFNGVDRYTAPTPQYSVGYSNPSIFGYSSWSFRGGWAVYVLTSSVQTPAQRALFEGWAKAEFALLALP